MADTTYRAKRAVKGLKYSADYCGRVKESGYVLTFPQSVFVRVICIWRDQIVFTKRYMTFDEAYLAGHRKIMDEWRHERSKVLAA